MDQLKSIMKMKMIINILCQTQVQVPVLLLYHSPPDIKTYNPAPTIFTYDKKLTTYPITPGPSPGPSYPDNLNEEIITPSPTPTYQNQWWFNRKHNWWFNGGLTISIGSNVIQWWFNTVGSTGGSTGGSMVVQWWFNGGSMLFNWWFNVVQWFHGGSW